MSPLDATWHLLGFFAPALGMALLAPLLAKLAYRRALQGVPLHRLAICALVACGATLVAGLLIFGRDGKIATYGAMVLACALSLYWAGGLASRPG